MTNWDQVGSMISSTLAEDQAAFDRLNEATFVTITGTSVALEALITTGQWKLEVIALPQEVAPWDPVAGVWTHTRINTNQNVLALSADRFRLFCE